MQKNPELAVQLYTVRDHTGTARDLSETLEKIAEIGYTAVQLSAVGAMGGDSPELSAYEARKMLDDNALKCVSTHRPWHDLLNETDREIEFHQTLGCDYAAIGGVPKDYEESADGYRHFIRDAHKVIERLKVHGIRFGHHNHSREFYREAPDQPSLEDILIDEGGDDLLLELDLYWIEHAGLNCVRILRRCHGRVPVIHIKDKEVVQGENETRMAPIGEGNLDWEGILPACREAGVRWYAVEQDHCYRDPFDCLKSSYEFLRSCGLE